jgi:hypothetical protein
MASSMDLLTLIEVVVTIIPVLLLAYASYWALSVRHSLAVRLYRNQALGIGLVSATFALLVTTVYGNLSPTIFGDIFFPLAVLPSTVTFYWVDASVLASRRTDPLLRDTIHWKSLRIALWLVLIVLIVVYFSALTYYFVTGISSPIVYVDLVIILIPLVSAAVAIPIISRRSRDMNFRRHLMWFALFGFSLFLPIVIGGILFPSSQPTFNADSSILIGVTIGGYCLYRSAKSLVPLNRISGLEVTPEPPPP